MRKNCSSDPEKLLKFEAEDREFAKILRSVEQFIQTVQFQLMLDTTSQDSYGRINTFSEWLSNIFVMNPSQF